MTHYKQESHYRSLIKGISWRIVATTDTVLVVLLVTCLADQCSLADGLKIGFIEFFLKLGIYYVHERIWQKILFGQRITKKRTLFKTISWRLVATTTTFIIAGAILNEFDEIALYIALTEMFTKFVLYYFHERLWLKLPLGRVRNYLKKLKK
ncbi:DUF2061 domain-containing protein [Gilvibacter sp.]|uniref:DUF2061 domain-containing protein n=1 Tax=Gilvibacter sp. TaxID=2729997 RepID=UPI0025BF0E6C|nr:DUF2061 domain-containing protein [Gilvibacter sp.]NQX76892.1 DUF2061 domain-containing protein [Gilvibacter sp.]